MVFESCPDFSDNSRGFWEYVVKNTDYKTYWVIRDEEVYEELNRELSVDWIIRKKPVR